ncbi:hypothetical protein NDA13_001214 [Ustilago tritici]|nr:hypothetical protein NDA13_001214 [Ustilago tritici]
MRSTLLNVIFLLTLTLCARTSPIPHPSSFRCIPRPPPRSDLSNTNQPQSPLTPPSSHPPSSLSLSKRTPNEYSTLKSATSAIEEASSSLKGSMSDKPEIEKAKDWKRRIVITISGLGVLMTVGWNYISLQSFLSNRARWRKEKARLEAEKNKPPPKVGDMMCTVETYSTEDQVAERKPGMSKVPCYRLGDASSLGQVGGTDVGIASGGVVQQQQTTAQMAGSAATKYAAPIGANQQGNIVAGPLTKRGLPEEIIEEASTSVAQAFGHGKQSFHSLFSPYSPYPPLPPSSFYWPRTLNQFKTRWIPLRSLGQPNLEEKQSSLSKFAPRVPQSPSPSASSNPANTENVQMEVVKAEEKKQKVKGKEKVKNILKGKRPGGKAISTDDITFCLTILNTVGGIPSLLFTMANAYYYRGNPKVD